MTEAKDTNNSINVTNTHRYIEPRKGLFNADKFPLSSFQFGHFRPKSDAHSIAELKICIKLKEVDEELSD